MSTQEEAQVGSRVGTGTVTAIMLKSRLAGVEAEVAPTCGADTWT